MKVRINGELKEVQGALRLDELLNFLNLKSNGIAVELNKEVVSKEKWAVVALPRAMQLKSCILSAAVQTKLV